MTEEQRWEDEVVFKVKAFHWQRLYNKVSHWLRLSGHIGGHQVHLCILMEDLVSFSFFAFRLSPSLWSSLLPPALILSDDLLVSPVLLLLLLLLLFLLLFLPQRRVANTPQRAVNDPQKHNNKPLLLICIFNGDSWTNYIFMDYKIRRGRRREEGGGMMPLAMQTGMRVPSAPASVWQEGPRGPAGRGDACYHQQY